MLEEIKESIHYQIQYFDRNSMAWRFDKKNYQSINEAKKDIKLSISHRLVEVKMPKNIITILETNIIK